MRTLSFPTLGLLIELTNELFDQPDELAPLMMRCDLLRSPGSETLQRILLNNVMRTRVEAEAGSTAAHRNLLHLAGLIVEKRINHPRRISPHQAAELREALLADGYKLTWESSLLPGDYSATCTILPTDAAAIPLADEISALESELTGRGYDTALNHYRQAVDGLANHKYESANGDLRTSLEDLVMRLAEDHAGYKRQSRAGQGGAAIAHLVRSGHLRDADGGLLLQGLWVLTHTNGSHPGHSDADEARFRMQVISATARFLLRNFPVAAA